MISNKVEGIPFPSTYFYYLGTKIRKGFYETLAEEIILELSSGKILDRNKSWKSSYRDSKRTPDIEIIGINISGSMVEIAKRCIKERFPKRRVEFEVMSTYDLSFRDAYFLWEI